MVQLLYYFDLLGVFAFAFLGARVGIAQKYNFLGIFICGFLTAVGGGTIRELLLGHTPFYFYNLTYIIVIAIASIASVILYHQFKKLKHLVLSSDAIGMITFAYIGGAAAGQAQLGIFGVTFFALLTACGGGVLCDLFARQKPHLFTRGITAVPPIIFGVGYWLINATSHSQSLLICLALLTLAIQLCSTFGFPHPHPTSTWFKQAKTAFAKRLVPIYDSEDA